MVVSVINCNKMWEAVAKYFKVDVWHMIRLEDEDGKDLQNVGPHLHSGIT
jgi:hypothetical protein